MPYTAKQCRFFGANQSHAPEDWKSKCKDVSMTDEGMDENEMNYYINAVSGGNDMTPTDIPMNPDKKESSKENSADPKNQSMSNTGNGTSTGTGDNKTKTKTNTTDMHGVMNTDTGVQPIQKKMQDSGQYIFYDKLQICDKSLNTTPEGYLTLQGIIARSGSQDYMKSELGLAIAGINDAVITLERPREEVTSPMSIASFMLKPITDEHPSGGNVNIDNFNQFAKGMVTSVEPTDEGKLKADLLVTDSGLATAIKNGKRELSAGYTANLDFSDDGKRAIQRGIKGNHVALVDQARCGRECTILDSTKRNMTMGTLKINDVDVEIQDSAIPVVQQLIAENTSLKTENIELKDSVSATQGKLDASEDKVKDLEASNLTDAEITGLAEEMAALWTSVKLVDRDFDCKGKSSEAIRKEIVVAKIGDSMKDKDDAYIAARFDVLVDEAKEKGKDPLSTSLKDAGVNIEDTDVSNIADAARKRKMDRYQNKNVSVGDSVKATDK